MFKLGAEKKTFDFEYDGKEYSLPSINDLPAKDMMALSRIKDDDERIAKGVDLQMGVIDAYCKGLLDKLTVEELNALCEEWAKESGISLGE